MDSSCFLSFIMIMIVTSSSGFKDLYSYCIKNDYYIANYCVIKKIVDVNIANLVILIINAVIFFFVALHFVKKFHNINNN